MSLHDFPTNTLNIAAPWPWSIQSTKPEVVGQGIQGTPGGGPGSWLLHTRSKSAPGL